MIPVDRNIPIPEPQGTRRKYPFPTMAVGDSFLVEVPREPAATFADRRFLRQRRMGSICRNACHRKFGRYITRTVDEGVRVWRVE